MNDFAFSPTTVIGTSGSDFGIVPLMTTSLYFSRESKKFWINPFPIKQFLVYIVVPFKLLLYILITVTTVKFLRLLKKEDKNAYFHQKRNSVFHHFSKWIFSAWVKFYFFVVHGSTILIDRERWHKIYSDEVLHCLTWICVIPACCFFFDECLNKETPGSIFWQKKENKSIVSVFSSTYSLVTASWCSVGLARVTIFYCSYLYQFLELIHQDCLRLLRNSFFFYFQINEFLQETTQFQVDQSEALL